MSDSSVLLEALVAVDRRDMALRGKRVVGVAG
jgi:hypothetical protein